MDRHIAKFVGGFATPCMSAERMYGMPAPGTGSPAAQHVRALFRDMPDAYVNAILGSPGRGPAAAPSCINTAVVQDLTRPEHTSPGTKRGMLYSNGTPYSSQGQTLYQVRVVTVSGAGLMCAFRSFYMAFKQDIHMVLMRGSLSDPTPSELKAFYEPALTSLRHHRQTFIDWAGSTAGGSSPALIDKVIGSFECVCGQADGAAPLPDIGLAILAVLFNVDIIDIVRNAQARSAVTLYPSHYTRSTPGTRLVPTRAIVLLTVPVHAHGDTAVHAMPVLLGRVAGPPPGPVPTDHIDMDNLCLPASTYCHCDAGDLLAEARGSGSPRRPPAAPGVGPLRALQWLPFSHELRHAPTAPVLDDLPPAPVIELGAGSPAAPPTPRSPRGDDDSDDDYEDGGGTARGRSGRSSSPRGRGRPVTTGRGALSRSKDRAPSRSPRRPSGPPAAAPPTPALGAALNTVDQTAAPPRAATAGVSVGESGWRRQRRFTAFSTHLADRLPHTLAHPEVMERLRRIQSSPEARCALANHPRTAIPDNDYDLSVVAKMLERALRIAYPNGHNPDVMLPWTADRENAITFVAYVLFPLLLATHAPSSTTKKWRRAAPLERATFFLGDVRNAVSAIDDLIKWPPDTALIEPGDKSTEPTGQTKTTAAAPGNTIPVRPEQAAAGAVEEPATRQTDHVGARPTTDGTTSGGGQATAKEKCPIASKLHAIMPHFLAMFNAGHVSKAASMVYRCASPSLPPLSGAAAKDKLTGLHPDRHSSSPRDLLQVLVNLPAAALDAGGNDDAVDVNAAEDAQDALVAVSLHELIVAGSTSIVTPRQDAYLSSDDRLLASLNSMARGTAPGPFGPSADLLRALIRRAGQDASLSGLNSLCCCLARDIASGRAPAAVYKATSESLLIGIGKGNGGVRPIAMADTWSKWGFRCLQASAQPDTERMLPDHQLGVMIPGGAEAAVLIHKIVTSFRPQLVTCITDAANAFNSVKREAILHALARRAPELMPAAARSLCPPSALWLTASSHPHTKHVEDWHLNSTEGVRQGDSMSPLLFSLVMEDILAELERKRVAIDPVGFILAFLDDGSIRAPYDVMCELLTLIVDIFAKYGLKLNPDKFTIYETPEAEAHIDALLRTRAAQPRYPLGLKPTDKKGYVFLGAPIGEPGFIKQFVSEAINRMRDEAHALSVLGTTMHLPMQAMSLLRDSFAHRLRHLARTTPPDIMEPALREFDALVSQTALNIVGEGADAVNEDDNPQLGSCSELARARIFRSAPKGGMAIRSSADTAKAAYAAGCLQAIPVIMRIASNTTDTFPELLTPERLTTAAPEEVAELCRQAPCLAPVLGEEGWAEWAALLKTARPEKVSGSLSQSGVLSGAIPAAPGAAGVSAAHRATHLDFISLAPAEVLRLAAAKKLPPRLQHVLSTVQEGARDAGVDESTLQTHEETLRAAKAVWGTADPLSRHLYALQMHACSGEGHMWVLDAGRRSDQFGRPRKGALHLHTDGPLDALLYRVAVRSRLMLPIGYLIREAQRHGGYDDTTWPLCHCHACRRRGQDGMPKRLDCMGMHLGTRVADGGYTPRHHTFNEAFTALVRAAGYSASIEKNPFKENKDRVARPPVRGRAEARACGR